MCLSSRAVLTALAATVGVAVVAAGASAAQPGRLDLLAAEAIDVMERSVHDPSGRGLLVLLAVPVATIVAAFLGTWLGIRGLSFGSLRHKDGWREVAYRFRSDEPLTVGKHAIRRMNGVLDGLEDLGKGLRSATPSDSGRRERPAPAFVPAAPAREVRRDVTFARREETRATRAATTRPVDAGRPVEVPRTDRVADAAGTLVTARDVEDELDREARYRRARALLRKGLDREAIRSRTGLKLAEIDLLCCVGSSAGESA